MSSHYDFRASEVSLHVLLGLLTGKHVRDAPVRDGRFKDNDNYLDRFYKKGGMWDGLELIHNACDAHGISMVQASYAWLQSHSQLQQDDGILIGASSLEQLDMNLSACGVAQPLPAPVLQAIDEAWGLCAEDAAPFWRAYHSDHPGRDNLDQGLAYAVKK